MTTYIYIIKRVFVTVRVWIFKGIIGSVRERVVRLLDGLGGLVTLGRGGGR